MDILEQCTNSVASARLHMTAVLKSHMFEMHAYVFIDKVFFFFLQFEGVYWPAYLTIVADSLIDRGVHSRPRILDV